MKKKTKKRKLNEKIIIIIETRRVFLNPNNRDIHHDVPLEKATHFGLDEKSASTTIKKLNKMAEKIIKNEFSSYKKIQIKFTSCHLTLLKTAIHNKKK